MIYLAEVTVERQDYMEDSRTFQTMRIVEADSESSAVAKVVCHFEEKSSPYSVSFYARVDALHPVIT